MKHKTYCFSKQQIGKAITLNAYVSESPLTMFQPVFKSEQINDEYKQLPDFKIKHADKNASSEKFVGFVIRNAEELLYSVAEIGCGAIICVTATFDKNAGEEVRISIDESKPPYFPANRLTNKTGQGTIELKKVKWRNAEDEICIEL